MITTYASRPEYVENAWDMPDSWPEFMRYDDVAYAFFGRVIETFPHLCVLATLDGVQAARGMAAPFALHGPRRDGELPVGGWDRVLT